MEWDFLDDVLQLYTVLDVESVECVNGLCLIV